MIAHRSRLIFWLTWGNLGWQAFFGFAWGFGLRDAAEVRWGVLVASLIQGIAVLGPTLIVAIIVLRWLHKIGIFP